MEEQQWVETAAMLAITGMDGRAWSNAIQRGHYKVAPPLEPGKPRKFTVNDVICAQVCEAFLAVGATAEWASFVAEQVSEQLKDDPDVRSLVLCKTIDADGRPTLQVLAKQVPGSDVVFVMPIADYRRKIRAAFREQYRRERDGT